MVGWCLIFKPKPKIISLVPIPGCDRVAPCSMASWICSEKVPFPATVTKDFLMLIRRPTFQQIQQIPQIPTDTMIHQLLSHFHPEFALRPNAFSRASLHSPDFGAFPAGNARCGQQSLVENRTSPGIFKNMVSWLCYPDIRNMVT